MNTGTRAIAVVSLSGALCASTAHASHDYMGHCTDDTSVPAENIISSCTTFITRAFQQNWQLEYVPSAMLYQATAYERLEKYEQAEAELKASITRYPAYTRAWANLGELLEKLKGPGMLMQTVDAMIRANPDNAGVLDDACWLRATKGEQLDAAVADCSESLRLIPGGAETLDSMALVYFRQGKFARAIADANSALAVNPRMATSLYVRGLAKLKSGDAAGGNSDIAAAKAIDAKVADTYAGYGVTP